jgi:hypothetical protein
VPVEARPVRDLIDDRPERLLADLAESALVALARMRMRS